MEERNLFRILFGEAIKLLRFEYGENVTLEKIASLTGLDGDYLGKIERGEKLPSVYILYKIFVGLEISVDKLFIEIVPRFDNDEDN